MNVNDLKALAKSHNVKGFSKLRKAELIVAIGDSVYDDAMAEYAVREAESFVVSFADTFLTEVVKRNRRRLNGYATVVGKNRHGGAAFTAKQRKRMLRKAHRAQNTWEILMIAEGRGSEIGNG